MYSRGLAARRAGVSSASTSSSNPSTSSSSLLPRRGNNNNARPLGSTSLLAAGAQSSSARQQQRRGSTTAAPAAAPSSSSSAVPSAALPRRRLAPPRAAAAAAPSSTLAAAAAAPRPLDVAVAGAGIGGLVLALALLRRSQPGAVRLRIFERDLTAIRGEGKYRGPIQVQSNALAALEAIDPLAADAVMSAGCVTGDRVNGLCDGVSGDWYVKFDTFHPAADRGLPVTRVISRVTLQRILADAVERAARQHEAAAAALLAPQGGKNEQRGDRDDEQGGLDVHHLDNTSSSSSSSSSFSRILEIEADARVVSYEDGLEGGKKVGVTLADGRTFEADLLIGADGIRSRVRRLLRLGPDSISPADPLTSASLDAADDPAVAAAAAAAFATATSASPPTPSTRRSSSFDDPRDAPTYAGYTCYTGISEFTPPDIDVVGYRVFLGNRQYFVSSDVGNGRMQWYAFHAEPAGGNDAEGARKARLLRLFGHWCPDVVDLIKATPEGDVLRRDIFDRPPIFSWGKGRVLLLGDSAHAMQPNLGQGGCMAIEDAFELGEIVREQLQAQGGGAEAAAPSPSSSPSSSSWSFDPDPVRREYESRRIVRTGAIHGMARAAAVMASTYKAHLGEGLGPAGDWAAQRLRIPHPGRVAGQAVLALTMPLVLEWVLGGSAGAIGRARVPRCRLSDTPRGSLSAAELRALIRGDGESLLRRARARWLLLAERAPAGEGADPTSTTEVKGVQIDTKGATVGRSREAAAAAIGGLPPAAAAATAAAAAPARDGGAPSSPSSSSSSQQLSVDDAAVAPNHARVWLEQSSPPPSGGGGDSPPPRYMIQDLGAASGTWVNGRRLAEGGRAVLKPGDVVEFGRSPSAEPFRVRLLHESLCDQNLSGERYTTMVIGARKADVGSTMEEEEVAALEAAEGARAVEEAALRVSASR
jgi:zeaxanthin epoxidase